MLELYMRLFDPRSVNFVDTGSGSGIGRDEVLGAAAVATKKHPLGNRVVLAEMGDQHSITALSEWARPIIGVLGDRLVTVVMGRPLPEQLEQLSKTSYRYDRARRSAKKHRELAENHAKKGEDKEAEKFNALANNVIEKENERTKEWIMTTGKCPRCKGTGHSERKSIDCPVCKGQGYINPDLSEIRSGWGEDAYNRFSRLVEVMQIERQEWVNEFMRQIQRERAA